MKRLKILIVDDMILIRQIIKGIIKKAFPHIEIEESSNGEDAKEKMTDNHYDLILCDWMMPDMKGDELLKWMKSHPSLKSTPFIMVTAKNERENIMEALQMGVTDYIIKPITANILNQKIRKVLNPGESSEKNL